jgi:hypothetical protein
MITSLITALVLASPLGLVNGDFRQVSDGKPDGWTLQGDCRLIPDGGRNGLPAIELASTGDGTNAALQELRLSPSRKGAFAVSAWMRCDEIAEGGDCSLWLDVIQDGGPPLWAQQGLPVRDLREWQQVRAEVRPTHPVKEVRVYLILRGVKGRVRFCDVRVEDIPFEIRDLRLYPDGGSLYQVRAALSEDVNWRVEAVQDGKRVWQSSGDGVRIADHFDAPGSSPVTLILTSELNGQAKRASVTVRQRKRAPAVDWWVADSLTRVFQDDLPPERPARGISLDVARGESESIQLCLRPTKQLHNVRVEASPLVCPSPQHSSLKPQLSWFRVGYVWVETPFAHPFSPRRNSAWWPDPLLPASDFSVQPGEVQPLWITVSVPRDAQPGDYTGRITVRADGAEPVSVPVSVTVHPATIPAQGHMKTAFALMDWHLCKVYGKVTPKLRRAYTDFLLAHRLNPDDISRTSPPDLRELVYANSRGLNAFNILNVVPEPGDSSGWVCWSPIEAYTPEFRKRFFERLDAIVPGLEKRGLIDKAYIYGFDERGPEYIPIIRDLFSEIKRRYPRVHTLSTCWPPAGTDPMSLGIDWYVPLSSSYDHKLAREVRAKGGEMWWYVCCGPNYPYANWLLENPLIESRLIWWQAFSYDVEGFLYWGLNIWERENNDKPIPSSAGPRLDWSVTTGGNYNFLNGDGVLLYPGENGPIGSIRLENIRDGLEDIELLKQYRDRFGADAARKLIAPVTTDRTHYTRDPNVLLKSRLAVLGKLRADD